MNMPGDLVVIADASDFGHMSGFVWGMMVFWTIIAVAIVAGAIWAIGRNQSPPSSERELAMPSPEQVLAERFARGEIDEEEYRKRRAVLRSEN